METANHMPSGCNRPAAAPGWAEREGGYLLKVRAAARREIARELAALRLQGNLVRLAGMSERFLEASQALATADRSLKRLEGCGVDAGSERRGADATRKGKPGSP